MTIFLILILCLLLINPDVVASEVVNSTKIWFYLLLPTMFPSFVIIDLISSSKLIIKISEYFFPLLKKIFKINHPISVYLILISLICGAPASTKIIKKTLDDQKISRNEANNLIYSFSCLSLPYTMLICNKVKLNLALYYSIFLLLSILWMQIFNKKEKIILHNNKKTENLSDIFFISIKKNTDILLSILSIIIFFKVITKILHLDNPIIYPYIEILGGHSITTNSFIFISSLGFLGISVFIQMTSIYNELDYKKFLLSRSLFFCLGFLTFI